jgi:uncharacterized protein (DUF302 family)
MPGHPDPSTTHNKEPPMSRTRLILGALGAICTLLAGLAFTPARAGDTPELNIAETVVMLPLEEGVSMDDAVDSMKLRANTLNFKLVAHQPLYKELQAMGLESRRIEIFQFCDARIAQAMIAHNKHFAAYLPCRIVLLEDEDGRPWLITMNLDPLIQAAALTPDLQEKARRVRNSIQEIMTAGAQGDL